MKKRLLIFDISNFIFRAFYAIRPLSAPDGTPVNAVYGVIKMITNTINDLGPTHVLIAQDNKGGSFRNELYDAYKANRSSPPDELIPQFAIIEEMLEVFKLPCVRVQNFEADDVIGSAAIQFNEEFDEILIASSDKDLMQFVSGKTKMVDTMKNKLYDRDGVFEKMGVYPEQIVDYLSLVGDASDNIPGVKGIGAKGASKLLAEYKTLDNIFSNVADIKNKRVLNGLTNHHGDAVLSKELIEIRQDVELGKNLNELEYDLKADDSVREFLEKYNFKSLIKSMFVSSSIAKKVPLKKSEKPTTIIEVPKGKGSSLSNEVFFIKAQLDLFFTGIKKIKEAGLHFENLAIYFVSEKIQFTYLSESIKERNEILRNFLSLDLDLIVHDVKAFSHIANEDKFKISANCIDFSLSHFAIYPYKKHDPLSIAEHLGELEFTKEDKKSHYKYLISLKTMIDHHKSLIEKIKEENLEKVSFEIDQPLTEVLRKMEFNGIKADPKILKKLSTDYHRELKEIQEAIFSEAPYECNLKSPKQVAELLFERLGLPIIKKNKTGPSTDASVLKTLEEMGTSPVPALINKYREIDKLLSTYIDTLPTQIDTKTKRIHTRFNQTGAATGRLSSDNPNLQNIPVKTQYGKNIRKAFIAEKGHQFISADYSQVELRILAHLSQDPIMLHAFNNDLDIHSQTASEVFDTPLTEMTPEIRSKAKAINFGLIYGQSSFGLSETLGIDRAQASEYITHYFEKFARIKACLDGLKDKCTETGYSETIIGRKRYIPEIAASNRNVKAFGDRMAVNSPIQGTAADILKLSMLEMDKKLLKKKMKTKMLLQIHDELIFEVPNNEIDDAKELIRDVMEGIIELTVPLKVDVSVGDNWYEL